MVTIVIGGSCMYSLNFSHNLANLRRKKKLTQKELADFIGVTKASVSKWENKQSLPDILLLPQLASFLDVSIDELLGYEAQLSREQIQKLYVELASDYTRLPFNEVMNKSRELVRRYYSCYSFLLQICILWLNHFPLAKDHDEQQRILHEAVTLCEHIEENCKVIDICNDAITVKAVFNLQLGKAEEVIEALEMIADPTRIYHQSDSILAQAYLTVGDLDKAKSYTQINMYLHVISLITTAVQYLAIHMDDLAVCEKTIKKTEGLIRLYDLNNLHPNSAAQFFYQAALVYITHGEKEKALGMLNQYVQVVRVLFTHEHALLHGDAYFDRLDEWISKLDLGASPPRNMRLVAKSVLESFKHPLLTALQDNLEFKRIQRELTEGVKYYE